MKNTFKMLLAVVGITAFAFTTSENKDAEKITVVIDAGHGGKDYGAQFEGFSEKEIVAQITHKILAKNSHKNVTIHLTRSEDAFLSLEDRIHMINKLQPDLVLSLHINQQANTNASGIEFFVSPNNKAYQKSKALAQQLDKKLTDNHRLKSRGIKDASFMVLKKSEFPAVTVELGFLSNETDRKYLTDDSEQDKLATTIVDFISELK